MKRLLLFFLLCPIKTYADSICLLLDQPGTYNLSALTISPTDANDTAICIAADNITLDFRGEYLTQDAANSIAGLTGVRVSPNVSNIVIRNANIRNFTGKAVVVEEGCQNITIDNIIINDCDDGGIAFVGTSLSQVKDGIIKNCLITSCTGAEGNPVYGIRLIESNNIEVNNCSFHNNDAQAISNGFGMSLENCTSCRVVNCRAHDNGGNALGVGISLFQTTLSVVENCVVLNTISRSAIAGSKSVGILLDQCEHVDVKECTVKRSNNAVADAFGFEARGGQNNSFENCSTKSNSAGVLAVGFALRNNELRSSIKHCRSRLNNGGVSGEGNGIRLTAQYCDILFNEMFSNTGATGVGLKDTVTDTTNLISGNVAFADSTSGFDVTRLVGTFPVITATVGNFISLATSTRYDNIQFQS